MEQVIDAEIRERGEITIPKKIREALHFESGQKVEFIPIGPDAVLMTSKKLELDEARRQIRRILKQSKASPEVVLKGLREAREETFQKHYGKKSHG